MGPDGALWFADGPFIGRITTTGETRSYALPKDVLSFGIATGPDAALWFTDQGTTAIGRMTVLGSVQIFPTPTRYGNPLGPGGEAAPYAITAGPDGALWFTEAWADKIGRITTEGKITEYVLPSYHKTHANPLGIVVGPDGGIWFGQPLTGSLGRLDPTSHKFDEFPITVKYSMPGFVTSAHDAIWFNEPEMHAIGRMTMTGAVKLFPIGQSDATPSEVGRGSDGNAWFLESQHNRIGNVDEDGKVRESPALAPGAVGSGGSIVPGPDGATWFVEEGAGRIGRIECDDNSGLPTIGTHE